MKLGLVDLLSEAFDSCARRCRREIEGEFGSDEDVAAKGAEADASWALLHAERGDYLALAWIAIGPFPYQDEIEVAVVMECWRPFREACDLARNIDAFLGCLALRGSDVGLERACRDDLANLAALGDWCEARQFLHAAAEARRLLYSVRQRSV